MIHLTEEFKIVDATAGPVTTNGGVTTDIVSTKNAVGLWASFQLTQAVGHATSIACVQATNVAGSTNKTGPTCQIWANEDTAATDTLVKKTSATSYAVTNDVKKKQVILYVDLGALDLANGYDCVYFTVSDSSQATNLVAGQFILEVSSKQATPPSVIIN